MLRLVQHPPAKLRREFGDSHGVWLSSQIHQRFAER